ncbi:MAG: plasma-membrane proton-efflux P-type ATPase, partial [Mangrovicoccus sp.]|nr:plasma-membrane proton-efflux P-type ATPase [Mangrovicoccus sp.]
LLVFNAILGFWQDRKASSALAALKKGLAPEATVLRDGVWGSVPAAGLLPGDVVKIRLGAIVPADLRLFGGSFAAIDESALTGESLPATKKPGDAAWSGSVVKQGEMEGYVIATGANTFFGRTAKLVAGAGAVSHAQKAMFQIGNFLILVAVVLAAVMVAVQLYRDIVLVDDWQWSDALNILQFVLVLLVAAIPVAMPAVFSVTMALGALALSREKAIVSRLAAIEEMAGVDILCSDKTGTLTKNALKLDPPILYGDATADAVILAAALASRAEDRDAIDAAVIAALPGGRLPAGWRQTGFVPFDPVTKRTEAEATDGHTSLRVAKGAPQAVVDLAAPPAEIAAKVAADVAALAGRGYRTLGVARQEGGTWTLLGLLPMFDPPRDDSKATIDAVGAKGVRIKMITGDDTAIAIETARQLGMGTNILTAADVFPKDMDPDNVPKVIADRIEAADGFARVFPEHKYAIVKALQARGHLVAMTGDGVNDAPALKQADCGTAVSGATDAARGAAALILTAPGLSVIYTAIDEARRIFGRITTYTIYRVALTMTIMLLVVLSVIFLKLQPLTPIMIVAISLLNDIPIMTIAYDNTAVSPRPIRWRMGRLLGVSAVLGFVSIVQTFALLLLGIRAMGHARFAEYGITGTGQLQTMMFLQLVAGGHFLLFVTRSDRWFLRPPFPALPLVLAMAVTLAAGVLMCGYGWFVPALPWRTVRLVVGWAAAWTLVTGIVRVATERLIDHRTRQRLRSAELVTTPIAGAAGYGG